MSKLLSVSLAVLLATATLALADDLDPPPWRGQWSTTTQWWDFPTEEMGGPGQGVKPDGPGLLDESLPAGDPYPPGYLPSTELWIDPIAPWIQVDPESGRVGIWPLSGIIEVVVDNHKPPNDVKLVWLQLTWREQNPGQGDEPIITPADMMPDFQTTDPVGVHEDAGLGWYHSVYTWEIYPNPFDEWFTIEGNIDVDQIVIDTWCIPEPATLVLLGIAGAVALLRKRRA